jgi:hypothetical protein
LSERQREQEATHAAIIINMGRNPLGNLDIPAKRGQYWRLREVCFQCEKR